MLQGILGAFFAGQTALYPWSVLELEEREMAFVSSELSTVLTEVDATAAARRGGICIQ